MPLYSSYLGGASDDEGRSIAVDRARDVYIGGATFSTNFPFRAYGGRPHDTTLNTGTTNNPDGFISKFRMECSLALDLGRDTVICPGDSIVIGNPVTPGTGLSHTNIPLHRLGT